MPINSGNLKKAEDLIVKLQMKLNSMAESSGVDPNSPDYQRTLNNLNSLRAQVEEFHSSSRKVDDSGKLTQDATPRTPYGNKVGEGGDYFYEPSVESVQQRLASDPELAKRLNLTSWTSSPDQLAALNEQSSAYKTIADDDWQQAAQKAEQSGKGITRYSQVKLSESPIEKIAGGIGKYMPAVAKGLDNVLLGGSIASAGKRMDNGAIKRDDYAQNLEQQATNEPAVQTATELIGSFAPGSIGNAASNAVTKAAGYAGKGVLGKIGTGALSGAIGSNVEGVAQDVNRGIADDKSVDDILAEASDNVTARTLYGGGFGAAGDILSQTAGKVVKSIRESPNWQDIRTLEEAGGGTHPIYGVKAPETVQANIDESLKPGNRGLKTPGDIAAQKVAPKIHESLKSQRQATVKEAEDNLGKYFQEYNDVTQPATEVSNEILNLLSKGYRRTPLGNVSATDEALAGRLRGRMKNFADYKIAGQGEVDSLIQQGGQKLTPAQWEALTGQPFTGNGTPVIIPHRLNPQQLHVAEQGLARDLGYSRVSEGKDDPALKAIQQALFKTRDQFTGPLGGRQRPLAVEPSPVPEPTIATNIQDIATVRPQQRFMSQEPQAATQAPDVTQRPTAADDIDTDAMAEADAFEVGEKKALRRDKIWQNNQDVVSEADQYYNEIMGPGRFARENDARKVQKILDENEFASRIAAGAKEQNYTPEAYAPTERPKVDSPETRASTKAPSAKHSNPVVAEVIASKKSDPSNTAKLDDGTEVQGLSALQRRHHEALSALEQAEAETGAYSPEGVHKKALRFKNGNTMFENEELANQAKQLGLENQMHEVAATNVYPGLRARAWFGSPNGMLNAVKDAALFRLDPILQGIANTPQNPFALNPNSPSGRIQQYLFEDQIRNALNMQGGVSGGRVGTEAAEMEKERDQTNRGR